MELIYVGHSGFVFRGRECSVIVDFYKDSDGGRGEGVVAREVIPAKERLYVLATHAHADHFNPSVLKWYRRRGGVRYVFSSDIQVDDREAPVCFLEKGGEWGDGVLRVKAFGSTDVGVSFLVEMEGERIFHAGDLNNWHWKDESTAEEARAANLAFLRELDVLSRQAGSVDVACFPVDPRLGADYALGARQFVDKVRPRVFVPMHFWGDSGKANAFQAYAEMRGCRFWALHRPGERVEIEGDELKYK